MEVCLSAKTPPKSMRLWVEPHIYHTTVEVEKEWRDTLVSASLKLLATLIKHYTKVINDEKRKLEETLNEVTTQLKHTANKEQRETNAKKWKALREIAQEEAKTISENLKELREKKTTQRKRRREPSQEDLTPQPKRSFVEALTGLMQQYTNKKQTQKNEEGPRNGGRGSSSKGKGPANARSYAKKTWPPPPPRRL